MLEELFIPALFLFMPTFACAQEGMVLRDLRRGEAGSLTYEMPKATTGVKRVVVAFAN